MPRGPRGEADPRIGFVYYASYTYFTSTYFPWMPSHGECSGEEFAAFAGIGILSSYLVLFISFYLATYRREGKAPSGRKTARRMSQAPLPDPHDIIVGKSTIINGHANGKATATGAKTNGVTTRSRKAL
jgi:fatty acid elongase 3